MKRIGCFLVLSLLCFGVAFAQEKAKTPEKAKATEKAKEATTEIIGSKSSKVYHIATCASVKKINAKNKVTFKDADEAVAAGYSACKMCKPPAGKAPEKAAEKKAPESKAPEKKAPEGKK